MDWPKMSMLNNSAYDLHLAHGLGAWRLNDMTAIRNQATEKKKNDGRNSGFSTRYAKQTNAIVECVGIPIVLPMIVK